MYVDNEEETEQNIYTFTRYKQYNYYEEEPMPNHSLIVPFLIQWIDRRR